MEVHVLVKSSGKLIVRGDAVLQEVSEAAQGPPWTGISELQCCTTGIHTAKLTWGKVEIPHTSQPRLLAITGDSRQTIALIPSVVQDVYSQQNLHIHIFLHCSYRSYPCSSPVPSAIKIFFGGNVFWGFRAPFPPTFFPSPFLYTLMAVKTEPLCTCLQNQDILFLLALTVHLRPIAYLFIAGAS